MLTVWRLVTARFAASAFSGEGARLYGGRWNRKGVPMVYTSGTQSLAMLEMLAQDDPLRARYVVIPASIPDRVAVERIAVEDLPAGWRGLAAREQLAGLGLGMGPEPVERGAGRAQRRDPGRIELPAQPAAPGLRPDRDRRAAGVRHRSAALPAVRAGEISAPRHPLARGPHFDARPVFSSTLNSTMRRIRSLGIGRFRGNCTEPLPCL